MLNTKTVEFLSILKMSNAPAQTLSPPQNRKTPHIENFLVTFLAAVTQQVVSQISVRQRLQTGDSPPRGEGDIFLV